MKKFIGAHPEFLSFIGWAKGAPWTGSYAEERYNSLNSFLFVDGSGATHTIRWSLIPAAQPVPISPDELAKRGPDFLEQEITQRVAAGPQRWTLVVTVANPGDPISDPSKAWPADRDTVPSLSNPRLRSSRKWGSGVGITSSPQPHYSLPLRLQQGSLPVVMTSAMRRIDLGELCTEQENLCGVVYPEEHDYQRTCGAVTRCHATSAKVEPNQILPYAEQ